MGYHPSLLVHAIDTIVLYGTPDETVLSSADRGECATGSHMQVGELPTTKEWLLLWQHQQTTILTSHPEVVLIVLEQSPHIRRTQVECCTLIVILPEFVLATWYPTKSSTDSSHKQIIMPIGDGITEELFVATYLRQVEIVVVHLSVAIVEQSMDTGHQYATFVFRKARNRTVW